MQRALHTPFLDASAKLPVATQYFLSKHSYICIDRRYCVFLDVRSDKYLAVARSTMARLAPCLTGWPEGSLPVPDHPFAADLADLAEDFLSTGLLTTSAHHGKPVRPQQIPQPRDSIVTELPRLSLLSGLRLSGTIARSVLWAHRRLSHHSFMSTIQAVIDGRESYRAFRRGAGAHRASSLIAAFNFWRPFHSRPNACLFECLAILHLLAEFGIFPSWVFGVIPEPFQAHCWLQDDTVVLNDSLSHVSDYMPILFV